MKKIILLAAFTGIYYIAGAQNKKFITVMEKNIAMLDTSRAAEQLQALANTFERIASAEKTE